MRETDGKWALMKDRCEQENEVKELRGRQT